MSRKQGPHAPPPPAAAAACPAPAEHGVPCGACGCPGHAEGGEEGEHTCVRVSVEHAPTLRVVVRGCDDCPCSGHNVDEVFRCKHPAHGDGPRELSDEELDAGSLDRDWRPDWCPLLSQDLNLSVDRTRDRPPAEDYDE